MASQLVKFQGIPEINQVLDALPKRVGGRFLRGILNKNAKILVLEAKRNASNADVTGETTKSIGVLQGKGSERNASVTVGPRRGSGFKGHTAHLQEYGTAPHTITAKPGKLLAWNGGFATSVRHPGTAPQPFMRPAVDSKMGEVVNGIRRDLRLALSNNFKDVNFD